MAQGMWRRCASQILLSAEHFLHEHRRKTSIAAPLRRAKAQLIMPRTLPSISYYVFMWAKLVRCTSHCADAVNLCPCPRSPRATCVAWPSVHDARTLCSNAVTLYVTKEARSIATHMFTAAPDSRTCKEFTVDHTNMTA